MTLRIAIVGGGIGGLAAALFLREAGHQASVYEQASEVREFGAGLVLAPNLVRPLARLGLADGLSVFAVRLETAWEFRRWSDGRVLFSQEMGDACVRMYGAPCHVAHRGDLLAHLQRAWPRERLWLDQRCVEVRETGSHVELVLADREGGTHRVEADLVIGADGIHSAVRPWVVDEAPPRFSGLCAFRCLVPADAAPDIARRPVQAIWLGPGRHFVHYPISAGRFVNVVAFAPAGDWRIESWTATGQVADLEREFQGWDGRLLQLVRAATSTRRWAMFDREPLERWCRGRVAMLGDAAHAMLPFFAQGAAQAVEDAVAIAACLRGVDRDGVPGALARYEAIRRPRASEVQLMSRGREVRNHLPDGPEQAARDSAFASGDPLKASAWLYGYDIEAACAAVTQEASR